MKRQAYGYRDQKFFELKILAMHEKNYAFSWMNHKKGVT